MASVRLNGFLGPSRSPNLLRNIFEFVAFETLKETRSYIRTIRAYFNFNYFYIQSKVAHYQYLFESNKYDISYL